MLLILHVYIKINGWEDSISWGGTKGIPLTWTKVTGGSRCLPPFNFDRETALCLAEDTFLSGRGALGSDTQDVCWDCTN